MAKKKKKPLNIEKLARKVFELMRKELTIEREREGYNRSRLGG